MKKLLLLIVALYSLTMNSLCNATTIKKAPKYSQFSEEEFSVRAHKNTKSAKKRSTKLIKAIAVPCLLAYGLTSVPCVDGGPISGLLCSNACALSCGGSGPLYLGCFAACNTLCVPIYASPSP